MLLLIFFASLSLGFSEIPRHYLPQRTFYDDFLDVLRASDNCNSWYNHIIARLHPRNHTAQHLIFEKGLLRMFLELRSDGLDDTSIESLLQVYCIGKSEVQKALNNVKPRNHLKFKFVDPEETETDLLSIARKKEQMHMKNFRVLRQVYTGNLRKQEEVEKVEKKVDPEAFKRLLQQLYDANVGQEEESSRFFKKIDRFYRIAAYIVTVSIALSIFHLLRQYYRDEDEDDEDEDGDTNFRVALMQVAVLFCSLSCIFSMLNEENEYE
uniref:Uncharacterized protein n=1 Tax=Caenorhabditis japonica TaxID=281687 RepID=A0A8R1HVK5_CAEJA